MAIKTFWGYCSTIYNVAYKERLGRLGSEFTGHLFKSNKLEYTKRWKFDVLTEMFYFDHSEFPIITSQHDEYLYIAPHAYFSVSLSKLHAPSWQQLMYEGSLCGSERLVSHGIAIPSQFTVVKMAHGKYISNMIISFCTAKHYI